MKNPRLLIFALALSLAPAALRAVDSETTPPAATPPGGARGRMSPAERLQKMKETLGLSDERTDKIKAIFQKNREKLTGLKGLKPEERRAKMREAIKGEMEEIATILTPEQKEKWKAEMQKRRSEHGGRRPGAAQTSA